MEVQRCKRCVMDNVGDDTIKFDQNGICNYCTEALSRMEIEYFPNQEGEKKLHELMNRIKTEGKGSKYDCMVGVSGGIDSSYILYLGFKFGLRMLAVHIDDGLDTEIAKENIKELCEKTNTDIIMIAPDKEQFADLTLAFLKAGVPNLAIPQDNVLLGALNDAAKKYSIQYSLVGGNFSLESILQRGQGINAADKKHIKAIHRLYGTKPIDKLRLLSMYEKYIWGKYFAKVKKVRILDLIDYNLNRALSELNEFCGFEYYGGKHYESILTRFLQCYYLPVKYNIDKRKSHYSSMIISNQMTRDDAVALLEKPAYTSEQLLKFDFEYISDYLGLSLEEFEKYVSASPKQHSEYPTSSLNDLAFIARRFRKHLGV